MLTLSRHRPGLCPLRIRVPPALCPRPAHGHGRRRSYANRFGGASAD